MEPSVFMWTVVSRKLILDLEISEVNFILWWHSFRYEMNCWSDSSPPVQMTKMSSMIAQSIPSAEMKVAKVKMILRRLKPS